MGWSKTIGATVTAGVVAATLSAAWSPAARSAPVTSDPRQDTPGFDGAVHAIAQRGSTVYVGGEFESVTDAAGQTFVRHGAAAFDSLTGEVLPWDPDVAGTVHDLAVGKEGVFLAGDFSAVKAKPRANLARVSRGGTADVDTFRSKVNGPVMTVALTRTRLYMGGSFEAVDGKTRHAAAALRRTGKPALTGWNPAATGGTVHAISLVNRGVMLGGTFSQLAGKPVGHLAKVTREKGSRVLKFTVKVTAPILDMTVRGNKVFVAAGGPRGGFAAAYGRGAGKPSWRQRFDGDAAAIDATKHTVYVGGHFDELCTTDNTAQNNGDCLDGAYSRAKLAAFGLNGAVRDWNPGANTALGVLAVTAQRRWVAVGGVFTEVAGEPHARFALFG